MGGFLFLSATQMKGRNSYLRSKQKSKNMILGVSDWLESKLGWSATAIRVAFVIAFLFFGAGLGLYLILWLVKILSK
jgi:phage shock protein PspC (stress-responsive transcriptional regulator)